MEVINHSSSVRTDLQKAPTICSYIVHMITALHNAEIVKELPAEQFGMFPPTIITKDAQD